MHEINPTIDPILIMGFERSGTTLLRRLISMCPALRYDLLHEQWRLQTYATASEAINNYRMPCRQAGKLTGGNASIESGEKIAYYDNWMRAIAYYNKWRCFWPHAKVLHIIRDPNDVARSCYNTFERDIKLTERAWEESVSTILNTTFDDKNCIVVSYEWLIENQTDALRSLYNIICGMEYESPILHAIMETQEPWNYNGRVMCGLRYKAEVQ